MICVPSSINFIFPRELSVNWPLFLIEMLSFLVTDVLLPPHFFSISISTRDHLTAFLSFIGKKHSFSCSKGQFGRSKSGFGISSIFSFFPETVALIGTMHGVVPVAPVILI